MTGSVEDPMDLSLCELCDAVASRRLTPTQTVDAALARIERLNPAVNAFVFVCATQVGRLQAQEYSLANLIELA